MQPYYHILCSASGTPICACEMRGDFARDGAEEPLPMPPVCDVRSLARIMLTLHGPSRKPSTVSVSDAPQPHSVSSLRLQLCKSAEEQNAARYSCVATIEEEFILAALAPTEALLSTSIAHIAVHSVLYSLSSVGRRTSATIASVHTIIAQRNAADKLEIELLNAGGASEVTKNVDSDTYLLASQIQQTREEAPQRLLYGAHEYIVRSMQDGVSVVHLVDGCVTHIAQSKEGSPALNEQSLRRVARTLWISGKRAANSSTAMIPLRVHSLTSMNARLQNNSAVQVVLFVAFPSPDSACVASLAFFPLPPAGGDSSVRRYHVYRNAETRAVDVVDCEQQTTETRTAVGHCSLSDEARAFSVSQYLLVDAALCNSSS